GDRNCHSVLLLVLITTRDCFPCGISPQTSLNTHAIVVGTGPSLRRHVERLDRPTRTQNQKRANKHQKEEVTPRRDYAWIEPGELLMDAQRPTVTPRHDGAPYRVGFVLLPDFSMIAFSAALEPLRTANRITGQ